MSRHYLRHVEQPDWADTPDEADYVVDEQERADEDWAETKADAESDLVLAHEAAHRADRALAGLSGRRS